MASVRGQAQVRRAACRHGLLVTVARRNDDGRSMEAEAGGRAMNAIMPLEEKYERALQSLGDKLSEAAMARGDAERLEARLKQRKAILTLKHRKEAGSAAMAETMA